MPHSLKSRIKSLCYKGEISEKERDKIIKALEQQSSETIHGSTYGGVSWGGTYKSQQPCEDCISRKKVIMLIDEATEIYPYKIIGLPNTYSDYNQGWTDACNWLYANIESDNLPSVTPKARWIPVSERLPEKYEIVLLTSIWHEVEKAMYIGDGMFDIIINNLQKEEVIAWMPLPEPYKAEGSDSE